jgi:hypothetical protein
VSVRLGRRSGLRLSITIDDWCRGRLGKTNQLAAKGRLWYNLRSLFSTAGYKT